MFLSLSLLVTRLSQTLDYIHNSEALPLSSDREYPDHTNPSESQLPKSAVRHSTIRRILAPSGGKVGSGYWPKTRLTLFILASFFLIALLAMHALEIARLSANKQGIGLLPATLVPLVIVYISLFLPTPAWSRGGWRKPARPHGLAWISGIVCWSLWMIITIGVKMWSFSRVYNEIGVEAYDGVGSKYPYSDKIVSSLSSLRVIRSDPRRSITSSSVRSISASLRAISTTRIWSTSDMSGHGLRDDRDLLRGDGALSQRRTHVAYTSRSAMTHL